MNKFLGFLLIVIIITSCKEGKKETITPTVKTEINTVIHEDYILHTPNKKSKAVLVLFGGYPENAEDIKREFNILDIAKTNEIAVAFMNYNQKLWLEQNEIAQLTKKLQKLFKAHTLPIENIYFGGFSSGGNIALLISNVLTQKNGNIIPKGVFIIDAPIDLTALYRTSEKNIKRNFSDISVEESTWLLATFEERIGNPNTDILKYQEYAVFTSETNTIDNIKNLKNTKIRLYTEPDTLWWKTNRKADYEDMNAFYVKKLSETLKTLDFKHVEYIPTKNKGFRANGERHPHSWSIVDKKDLMQWMLRK